MFIKVMAFQTYVPVDATGDLLSPRTDWYYIYIIKRMK